MILNIPDPLAFFRELSEVSVIVNGEQYDQVLGRFFVGIAAAICCPVGAWWSSRFCVARKRRTRIIGYLLSGCWILLFAGAELWFLSLSQ